MGRGLSHQFPLQREQELKPLLQTYPLTHDIIFAPVRVLFSLGSPQGPPTQGSHPPLSSFPGSWLPLLAGLHHAGHLPFPPGDAGWLSLQLPRPEMLFPRPLAPSPLGLSFPFLQTAWLAMPQFISNPSPRLFPLEKHSLSYLFLCMLSVANSNVSCWRQRPRSSLSISGTWNRMAATQLGLVLMRVLV